MIRNVDRGKAAARMTEALDEMNGVVYSEGLPALAGSPVWGTGGDLGITRDGAHVVLWAGGHIHKVAVADGADAHAILRVGPWFRPFLRIRGGRGARLAVDSGMLSVTLAVGRGTLAIDDVRLYAGLNDLRIVVASAHEKHLLTALYGADADRIATAHHRGDRLESHRIARERRADRRERAREPGRRGPCRRP